MRVILQLEPAQVLTRAVIGLARAQAVYLSEGQGDVLQGGEVGEQVEGLEDHANLAAVGAQVWFVVAQGLAVDGHRTGLRNFQPGQHA